ncbi:MAG: DUF3341 domain-containing protein [Planctomycetaceae bacterium]|nr:DUF3341 domain-containing protein [Planctomycetaceae bacterium]
MNEPLNQSPETKRWGHLSQFSDADSLLAAVKALRDDGYEQIEAFTPFPLEGLSEQLHLPRTPMPLIILIGGLLGGSSIYALEYWVNLSAYPLNIGGRPLHSWPSFIPPAFEGVVLGAAIFGVYGLLWVCGLPRLNHPVFEIEEFQRASVDGFFLAIEATEDPSPPENLESRLQELGATGVWEVPDV